jgi:hypothetical protein
VHDEVDELVQLHSAVLVHVGLAEEFPQRGLGEGWDDVTFKKKTYL